MNDLFFKNCKTDYKKNDCSIVDHERNIVVIKNFFHDPLLARKFFLSLPKWECLDDSYKGGLESFVPSWIVKFLLKDYFHFFGIEPIIGSEESVINHFYYGNIKKDHPASHFNENIQPHYDSFPDDCKHYICLVNLTESIVETDFWSISGKDGVNSFEDIEFYNKYIDNCTSINSSVFRKSILYNFNECIIYEGNLFHSPKVEKHFTKDNLRTIMRLSYSEGRKSFTYI